MRPHELDARLREIRSRAQVRKWELRQLGHARGVWFRWGRLLTYSRRA